MDTFWKSRCQVLRGSIRVEESEMRFQWVQWCGYVQIRINVSLKVHSNNLFHYTIVALLDVNVWNFKNHIFQQRLLATL
jgi:hypothetical protein